MIQSRILVAGVGNIFHGDDAFGSEVARRLAETPLTPGVRVIDFGIRGHDLAFALQEDYAAVILIDVAQRNRHPGELSVLQPDLSQLLDATNDGGIDSHAMNPTRVLSTLVAQGIRVPPIWIVACEPLTLGAEEGQLGLSEPVASAVPEAVVLVRSLLETLVRS